MTHTQHGHNAHVCYTIAEALEAEAKFKSARGAVVGFDMSTYVDMHPDDDKHTCGTTACIAGWVVALFDEKGLPREKALGPTALKKIENNDGGRGRGIHVMAAQILGLNDWDSNALFCPPDLASISASDAAKTLRHLAVTGAVDWQPEVNSPFHE